MPKILSAGLADHIKEKLADPTANQFIHARSTHNSRQDLACLHELIMGILSHPETTLDFITSEDSPFIFPKLEGKTSDGNKVSFALHYINRAYVQSLLKDS